MRRQLSLTYQIGISVRNILAGQSTIEVERARPSRKPRPGALDRRRYVSLPDIDKPLSIDPDLRLYDLGPMANWRATMGERPIDWFGALSAFEHALNVAVPWRPRCAGAARVRG